MNNDWKQYKRKGLSEMIEYSNYNFELGVERSISEQDRLLSEEDFNKGYVARNPKNHKDVWYVAKKYFDENLEEV